MKYIYLLLITLLFSSCAYEVEREDYNYLEDNSIRFIRTNNDTSFLINKDNIYYLLLLGNENIDIEVDYLIKYKNVQTSNKYEEEYFLDRDLVFGDLVFKINDKIEIIMNNNTFCIYLKELDKDNYSQCDFIYLYNPDRDFCITLSSDLKSLFYQSYTKFNYKFLQHLGEVWIDSYTINSSSYLTLTLLEDDFTVESTKIRGKTIHKRENS